MSLLWMDYETEFQNLVNAASGLEQEGNPEYFAGLSSAVKKIIYRDTRYNVDFLYTAYVLKDSKVIRDYAVWLYELMASVLKNRTRLETVDYVVGHLEYIKEGAKRTVSEDKLPEILTLIENAQESIREHVKNPKEPEVRTSLYEEQIQEYMETLFEKNTRKALALIKKFTDQGIPATTVYVEILAESMRRVGELWHTAKISVDTEHYCTSVTQMAMAQMYPVIFSDERKDKTILCACPGTELHEIGARMVADVFENDGWDGIFLGAAVPEEYLMKAIRENKPDLVALSVTMPQHLMVCADLVKKIKEEFPDMKVAVGGGAFKSTHEIWKQWPVDIYSEDARELLARANEMVCQGN